MKKTLRNLVIGAVVTAGIFATSTAALAAGTQFVQNDMNFRNGPSTAATIIGSVPAGAQVEVIDLQNGWNLVRYNGRTGYIHGGNLGDSYVESSGSEYPEQPGEAGSHPEHSDGRSAGTGYEAVLRQQLCRLRAADAEQPGHQDRLRRQRISGPEKCSLLRRFQRVRQAVQRRCGAGRRCRQRQLRAGLQHEVQCVRMGKCRIPEVISLSP